MSSAASGALSAKAVTVLLTVTLVTAAGIGGAVAGTGPTAGLELPFAQQQDSAPAPETAVHLDQRSETVQVGGTATYDVVVANASGGVGEHASVVSIVDPSVASITDVSLHGNQSGESTTVSIDDDGASANITTAPTNIEGTDSVVASVTVTGEAAGSSDIGLRVDTLSTDAGDAYDVTAVSGAALTVESTPRPANFQVSELRPSRTETQDEPFNVSVAVTNLGDLEATQTVRLELNQRVGDNGTTDEQEVTLEGFVTLEGYDRETVTFTDVNVTDFPPGLYEYSVSTENDSATGLIRVRLAPPPDPETTVLLWPSDVPFDADASTGATETIESGDTTTYDVVVTNASGGVGAQDLSIDIDDPTYATIADASVPANSSIAATEITLVDDGHAVNITTAVSDTDDNGTVTIASVVLEGHAVGTTDIGLRVNALGTEAGIPYNVTAVTGSSITVESDGGGSSPGDGGDGPGDDQQFTRDEISLAKYGVVFENLGSQTSGEVQAIYNRQPFANDSDPADVQTRNEISNDRYGESFSALGHDARIEVQNEYDAQFGPLPSDPAYTRNEISLAKYDVAFADLSAGTAGEVQAIYNRQPFPADVAPEDIRTRDEISRDRHSVAFVDLSRQTTIDIQNDYDAQFDDGE